jgi:hypothetical protein
MVIVSNDIARRNTPGRTSQSAQVVIWSLQTDPSVPVDQNDPLERTVPALDPSREGPDYPYLSSGEVYIYTTLARSRRDDLARHYLALWIDDDNYDLGPFERETLTTGGRIYGKMSQFINFYRTFTCANLNYLLNQEFPATNLPHMLRQPISRTDRAIYEWRKVTDANGNVVSSYEHFHASFLTQQKYLDLVFYFYGLVYR